MQAAPGRSSVVIAETEADDDGWASTTFEYSDGTKVSIASMGFLRGTVVDRDNDIDETGRMVWPGSRVLGLYLTANPHVVRGKRVLEMGAGCGVSGLIAARFAAKVVLTDRNEEVVEMLNQNIELNSLQDKAEGMVMKWVDDLPALKEKYPPFETIIGSDVIYPEHSHLIPALFETVDAALACDESSLFVISFIPRTAALKHKVLKHADKFGFACEQVPTEEYTTQAHSVASSVNYTSPAQPSQRQGRDRARTTHHLLNLGFYLASPIIQSPN